MNENKQKNRERWSDCLILCGGITVSVGVGLIHVAAGIIIAGCFAVVCGWLIGRGGDRE